MSKKRVHSSRPDVQGYHDYRRFLVDSLSFLKGEGTSLRDLAKKCQIAVGYLPMVISGKRSLSPEAMAKLVPELGLGEQAKTYLSLLVTVADSDSHDERLSALEKLQRLRNYKERNPKELEVYRYLTRWYYVAIREMAGVEGFRPEPQWIQARLQQKVSLSEIEDALKFLREHGYLEFRPDGSVAPVNKTIECVGGVYRVALAEFHRAMLAMAGSSMQTSPSSERAVMGHTLSIPEESYDEVQNILTEALDRIAKLERTTKPKKRVYQVEVAAFPLTKKEGL